MPVAAIKLAGLVAVRQRGVTRVVFLKPSPVMQSTSGDTKIGQSSISSAVSESGQRVVMCSIVDQEISGESPLQ